MTFRHQVLVVLPFRVARITGNSELATFAKVATGRAVGGVYTVLPGVNWTHRKHLDAA